MTPRRALTMFSVATVLMCGLAMLALLPGCKKKEKNGSPAGAARVVTGLDAVPRDVNALIGVNASSLRGSWLVGRAVAQMFRRDPDLKKRVDDLIKACAFDPARDLDSFVIGIGGSADTDQAVMVVTGTFVEAELASCMGKSAAEGGGSLTVSRVDGRTLYNVGGRGGRRDSVWFTSSGPKTLVVATSSEWLAQAVGRGPKVSDSPVVSELLGKVDRKASIWVAGEVDASIGQGLVELGGGTIQGPPRTMFGTLDLQAGARLELAVGMGSDVDAKSLVSLLKTQLSLGALAAQRYGLGALVGKLGVDSEGKTVYLRMSLGEDELRELLARIDTSSGSAQNPTPN